MKSMDNIYASTVISVIGGYQPLLAVDISLALMKSDCELQLNSPVQPNEVRSTIPAIKDVCLHQRTRYSSVVHTTQTVFQEYISNSSIN